MDNSLDDSTATEHLHPWSTRLLRSPLLLEQCSSHPQQIVDAHYVIGQIPQTYEWQRRQLAFVLRPEAASLNEDKIAALRLLSACTPQIAETFAVHFYRLFVVRHYHLSSEFSIEYIALAHDLMCRTLEDHDLPVHWLEQLGLSSSFQLAKVINLIWIETLGVVWSRLELAQDGRSQGRSNREELDKLNRLRDAMVAKLDNLIDGLPNIAVVLWEAARYGFVDYVLDLCQRFAGQMTELTDFQQLRDSIRSTDFSEVAGHFVGLGATDEATGLRLSDPRSIEYLGMMSQWRPESGWCNRYLPMVSNANLAERIEPYTASQKHHTANRREIQSYYLRSATSPPDINVDLADNERFAASVALRARIFDQPVEEQVYAAHMLGCIAKLNSLMDTYWLPENLDMRVRKAIEVARRRTFAGHVSSDSRSTFVAIAKKRGFHDENLVEEFLADLFCSVDKWNTLTNIMNNQEICNIGQYLNTTYQWWLVDRRSMENGLRRDASTPTEIERVEIGHIRTRAYELVDSCRAILEAEDRKIMDAWLSNKSGDGSLKDILRSLGISKSSYYRRLQAIQKTLEGNDAIKEEVSNLFNWRG